MDHDIENYIIKGLFENMTYFRNTALNLDPLFFEEDKEPVVKFIKNYFSKYEKIPEYSVVMNVLMGSKSLSDDLKEDIEVSLNTIKKLDFDTDAEEKWLFDQTKEFANNQSFKMALKEGVEEMQKDDKHRDFGSVQRKMEKALSLTWDEDFGIEFFDENNIDEVYDKLSDVSLRIPLGESNIDNAINGGIPGETKFCGVFVGEAGIGKTLILGHSAMNAVKHGKNVLYITFEIDEKEFRKRMDASFTDFSINSILKMRDKVKDKIKEAKSKGETGRFIIKEYPPASVSALEIESFLYSLKLKKDFTPDIIYLDYLGIMVPISKDAKNSYERGKMVCEEIRALSDRFKCPIMTASQANRSGYGQNTVDMDNIADSMGIAHTADLIISLAQPDELKENSQIKFEVIKSRISRKGAKGIVDVDYERMKFIDQDEKENTEVSDAIDEGLTNIVNKKKDDDEKSNNDGIT